MADTYDEDGPFDDAAANSDFGTSNKNFGTGPPPQISKATAEVEEAMLREPIKGPPKDPPKGPSKVVAGPPEAPYTEERVNRIKFFYKKREGNPARYTYDEQGDLAIFSKSGTLEETIPLRNYVPLETELREARDQDRLETIAAAETKYEEALKTLREAQDTYRSTGAIQPMMAAQMEVEDADSILSKARYGARTIQSLPNPVVSNLLFDKPHEKRRLFPQAGDPFKKELSRLIVLEYPYFNFDGKYVDRPKEEEGTATKMAEEAIAPSVRQRLKDGRYARVFYDADEGVNGILSPFWPVDFTMESTRYSSPIQAYEATRALEVSNSDLRKTLLGTRSVRTIRFLTKGITTQPKDPKGLWMLVFTNVYQQHPEMKEKLLATGTDALVFADTKKGPSGVGLGERDVAVLDPAKWQGENAVGTALEALRYQFREGTAALAGKNAAPKESVISVDQQAAAKQGAVINAQKKKFVFKPRA